MSLEKTQTKTERLLEEDERYIGAANKVRLFLAAAASASGSTITDLDGKRYLDFAGGWAVATTGYSHPRIVDAVSNAMEQLSFSTLATLTHPAAIDLAKRLLEVVPTAK